MENSLQIQTSSIGSSSTDNSQIVFGPTASTNLERLLGSYNYQNKYVFFGIYITSFGGTAIGIARINDLNNLSDYTTVKFSPYIGTNLTTINTMGSSDKIYCSIGPYETSSKRLVLYEVDIETLNYQKVLDTTTSQANYVYIFDLTGDGNFAYISDNGPFSRIYKYNMSTWTLVSTYISLTNGRMGQIDLVDGFLYAITYQTASTNSPAVPGTAYNYVQKIDPNTMTLMDEHILGSGISITNIPFSSVPFQKSGTQNKRNFIKIGDYLYLGFGRNPSQGSSYSMYRFNTNDLSDFEGFYIEGFTSGGFTYLSNVDDQIFIYDNTTSKVCQYNTVSNEFIILGELGTSPAVSSTTISVIGSTDQRVIYTAALGTTSLGKLTKQRYS